MFGERGFQPKEALNQLYAFGARAYRRPLTSVDRATIRQTYDTRIREKATPRQAALDTLKMMLCSPSFLYFSEITDEKKPKLGPYDLASRLSYALWSAPPDKELLAAAASGKLTAPKELGEAEHAASRRRPRRRICERLPRELAESARPRRHAAAA